MTPRQYEHARAELGWTHERMAEALGVSIRTEYRYGSGETEIPESVARLLRLMVRVRLTKSIPMFDRLVKELQG